MRALLHKYCPEPEQTGPMQHQVQIQLSFAFTPKWIQFILCSGVPEHVSSPYHKAKLASPIFTLLGCWNDWSWIGNKNLSPIWCLGHYVAAYSRPIKLLAWRRRNSSIITIENCLLQLTPFRRATFKVKLRKVELPSTAARALNL